MRVKVSGQSKIIANSFTRVMAEFFVQLEAIGGSVRLASRHRRLIKPPVTVLSYNVRNQGSDNYCKDWKSNTIPCPYKWENRKNNVKDLIYSKFPDIFGIQETSSPDLRDFFEYEFLDHYKYHKPRGTTKPKYIFYKSDKFELIKSGRVVYTNPYNKSEDCYQKASERTFSWVKLKMKGSSVQYLVINTHWASKSHCYSGREAAAYELIDFLGKQELDDHELIVLGDFNTDPSTYGSEDSITNLIDFGLQSTTYLNSPPLKKDGTYNKSWRKPSKEVLRIDYILYKPSKHRTLVHRNFNVDQSKFNGYSPSDHFPISVELY